jgi:excisionase family DNA binding protein
MRAKALQVRAKTAGAPLLLSYPAAQHALGGLHRGTIRKLVQQGKLELVKIGTRSLITARSVHSLAGDAEQPASGTS